MILKQKKFTKPQLSLKDLVSMFDLLSSSIVHPWLCKTSFVKLHTTIVHLLDSTTKIIRYIKTNIAESCHVKALTLPARTPELNSQVSEMKATNVAKPEYKALSLKQLYEPLHLAEFEPEYCYVQRHWVGFLSLLFPIKIFRMAYGGNMGTMNYAWRLPLNDNFDET